MKTLKNKILFFSLLGYWLLAPISSYSQITWKDVDGGVNLTGGVRGLGVYANKLIVSGGFNKVGNSNIPANSIASWDSLQWDSLGRGVDALASGMAEYNGDLFVGGNSYFDMSNFQTEYLAKWDGTNWLPVTTSPPNQVVNVLEYKNTLFLGGNFTSLGGVSAKKIASYDGSSFSTLSSGLANGGFTQAYSMVEFNGDLIVGGDFNNAGSITAHNIARWNGTAWDSLGGGTDALIYRMCVDTVNNFLYASGAFWYAGGIYVKGFARWDGEKWSAIGNPLVEDARALCMYHNELFVGSTDFTDTVLTRWDGKNWYEVKRPNGTVMALYPYKDELYIGGLFDSVNTQQVNYVTRLYMPLNTDCNYLQAIILGAMDTAYYYSATDSALVQLKNNIKGASSWDWDFGDGDTGTGLSPTHYYTASGTYPVRVIVTYGSCIDTAYANVIVTQTTGINDLKNKDSRIKIFPNPTKQEINLSSEILLQNATAIIYSTSGEKLKEVKNISGKESKISLHNFSKGVYFLKLFDKENKILFSEKVILE